MGRPALISPSSRLVPRCHDNGMAQESLRGGLGGRFSLGRGLMTLPGFEPSRRLSRIVPRRHATCHRVRPFRTGRRPSEEVSCRSVPPRAVGVRARTEQERNMGPIRVA